MELLRKSIQRILPCLRIVSPRADLTFLPQKFVISPEGQLLARFGPGRDPKEMDTAHGIQEWIKSAGAAAAEAPPPAAAAETAAAAEAPAAAALASAAVLQAQAQVQADGKGEFVTLALDLSDSGVLRFSSPASGEVVRTANVKGAQLSAPKSVRKGHELCTRYALKPHTNCTPRSAWRLNCVFCWAVILFLGGELQPRPRSAG